jgi:hypothetical protein
MADIAMIVNIASLSSRAGAPQPTALDELVATQRFDRSLKKAVKKYDSYRRAHDSLVESRWGLSRDRFRELSQEQGGRCKLCGAIPGGSRWRVHMFDSFLWPSSRGDRLMCTDCIPMCEKLQWVT